MKIIYTNKMVEVMVDDDKYDTLTRRKWRTNRDGYVVSSDYLGYENGKLKKRAVSMSREVMGAVDGDGKVVDHIDGNPLNNQASNLRFVTIKQNCQNRARKKSPKATSKYKGVTRHSKSNGWQVFIAGKYAGYFADEKEAAKKYNELATEIYGEYARLNEVM